ncbi:HIT-like domain-containing protein [Chytriomyces sp. MP71]|nr:HIT-like domain-containing protein [Chytriomyces sp. MP71]
MDQRLAAAFDAALACGHLVFTPSTVVAVHAGRIAFQVRFAPSLAKKPTKPVPQPQPSADATRNHSFNNPFLSPEPELLVDASLLPLHNILLNKFSIVKGHALITTKHWESQSEPLSPSDMAAAFIFLHATSPATPHLAFFNCGPLSGASVPHKHLQFIPVPAQEGGIPIQPLLDAHAPSVPHWLPTRVPGLPFLHRAAFFPSGVASDDPRLHTAYMRLVVDAFSAVGVDFHATLNADPAALRALHADSIDATLCPKKEMSYNVIFTRTWMVLVPRRAEAGSVSGVSVNSVGFAGMVLVKSEEQLNAFKSTGQDGGSRLAELLAEVAYPSDSSLTNSAEGHL